MKVPQSSACLQALTLLRGTVASKTYLSVQFGVLPCWETEVVPFLAEVPRDYVPLVSVPQKASHQSPFMAFICML